VAELTASGFVKTPTPWPELETGPVTGKKQFRTAWFSLKSQYGIFASTTSCWGILADSTYCQKL
jgi:hypothetical protein